MSIKAKILTLVATFAVVAAAICALALTTMQDYQRAIAEYTRASDDAFRGERLNLLIADSIIEMRNIYLTKTPDELAHRTAALQSRIAETRALMSDWRGRMRPGEVPYFSDMQYGANSVGAFGEKVIAIAKAQGPAAAEKFGLDPKAIAGREVFQARLDAIVAGIQDRQQQTQEALRLYQQQRMLDFILIAGTGSVIMLLAALWVALTGIANPLKRISQSVIRISEGAYDTAIPASQRDDEISRLWSAVAILKDRAIEAKRLSDEKLELRLD